jgi:DNA-binding transcriptional LysR family regulator
MELRHLRYFVVLADELHFARAAGRLGIAQPSLSQQIRRLEEELRVSLLQRTKRRVQLTQAGRLFLGEAHQILNHAERAASALRPLGRGEGGWLPVGLTPWMDFTDLPDVIGLFGKRRPGVQFDVHTGNVSDQLAALRDGRLHAAFLRPPVNDRTLSVEPVLREPLIVALPRKHALTRYKRIPLRALAGQPYVILLREKAPAFYDLVMSFWREAGLLAKVRHEADHPLTVLRLVSAGRGISLVPASCPTLGIRGIAFRGLTPSRPVLETLVGWRRNESSPVVHAFITVVRQWRRERLSANRA